MVTLSLGNKKKTYPSIKAAALDYGIQYITLYRRLKMGWSVKKALTTPVRKLNKNK